MLLIYVVAFSLGPILTNTKSIPEANENIFVNAVKEIFDSGPFQEKYDFLPLPQPISDNNSTDLKQEILHPSEQLPTYYSNGINQEALIGSNGWPITPVTFHQPIQSPVDIVIDRAVTLELPMLSMALPNLSNTRAKLYNSGTTAVVYMYGDKFQKPFLKGGPLKERFIFEQMHFHWGKEDIWGSEHYMDGESYSAEVHIVYYNGKYLSFKDAAKKTRWTGSCRNFC
uniref:Carbonic anhydrase n=1 Tax=Cuerna arida TaxID=1464854 RepID=A0A1B6GIN4_9HEMI